MSIGADENYSYAYDAYGRLNTLTTSAGKLHLCDFGKQGHYKQPDRLSRNAFIDVSLSGGYTYDSLQELADTLVTTADIKRRILDKLRAKYKQECCE